MKRTDRQRGTQLLELAIVTPLLVFLALSICEGAAFVRMHQVLNNAAREAARVASSGRDMYCTTAACTSAIRQVAINYANNNGVSITAAEVTVNQNVLVPTPSGIYMRASSVVVSHPYSLQYLPSLPFFNVASTVTLTGSAEFRNLM